MQITNKFIKIKKFYLDLIILALKHFESHFLCTKVQLEKDIIDIFMLSSLCYGFTIFLWYKSNYLALDQGTSIDFMDRGVFLGCQECFRNPPFFIYLCEVMSSLTMWHCDSSHGIKSVYLVRKQSAKNCFANILAGWWLIPAYSSTILKTTKRYLLRLAKINTSPP